MARLKFHHPDMLGEEKEWSVDDQIRIWINGELVIDQWSDGCHVFTIPGGKPETGCKVVENPEISLPFHAFPADIRIKARNVHGPGAMGPLSVTDLETGQTVELTTEEHRTEQEGAVFFDKSFKLEGFTWGEKHWKEAGIGIPAAAIATGFIGRWLKWW